MPGFIRDLLAFALQVVQPHSWGEGDSGAGKIHNRRSEYSWQCKERPLKVSWKWSAVFYWCSDGQRAGMGMPVFGLAAELTTGRGKETNRCYFLLLVLSVKWQSNKDKVLCKTKCWMVLEISIWLWVLVKGKQGKQRGLFHKNAG